MRGGEKVLEVLCELFPQGHLFTLFHEPENLSPLLRAMPVQACALNRIGFLRRRYRALLPVMPWLIERFNLSGYDLVLSTSSCVAKGARPGPGVAHVCYCHSPMRYVWDLYDAYREQSGFLTAGAMALFRKPLQRWDVRTASRVTHYLANSRNIADKIERYYGRVAEVVHPPVDCQFYRPDHAGSGAGRTDSGAEPYYFVCSAMVPYKRLDIAIAACQRLGRRLVIAGKGPDRQRLKAMAGPGVTFTEGWISDEALRDLYARSRAFLFPGEEDFGIAPVEAMACGRPVIAYGRGGALETVVDGQTGVLFAAQTVDAMTEAIVRFEAQAFDSAAIRRHAEGFDRSIFRDHLRRAIVGHLEEFSTRGPSAS